MLAFVPTPRWFTFLVRAKRVYATSGRAMAVMLARRSVCPTIRWFTLGCRAPPLHTAVGQAFATACTQGHVAELLLANTISGTAISVRRAIVATRVVLASAAYSPTVVWSTFFVCSIRCHFVALVGLEVTAVSTRFVVSPTVGGCTFLGGTPP